MLHSEGAERESCRQRADFFYRYATATLAGMPTRSLARPVVLLLSNGWLRPWIEAHPGVRRPEGLTTQSFPGMCSFEPQKQRAIRRAKRVGLIGAALFVLLVAMLMRNLF